MKDVFPEGIFYTFLILLLQPVYSLAQTDLNPVVIQYGDIHMDRREFELEFEMVMVLKAVESGVPIKSQDQIVLMQQRYLEQRAKELVLTDVAMQRGITLSEAELDNILDDYMKDLGFSGYSMANMNKLGLTEDTRLRAYLQRREILTQILTEIRSELPAETDNKNKAVKTIIDRYYIDSGIRVFPEFLQRPFGE